MDHTFCDFVEFVQRNKKDTQFKRPVSWCYDDDENEYERQWEQVEGQKKARETIEARERKRKETHGEGRRKRGQKGTKQTGVRWREGEREKREQQHQRRTQHVEAS